MRTASLPGHAVTNGTLGTVDLTGVADGNYTVHVVAKDKAGNTTEATQNFVLDNVKPTAKFTSSTTSPTPNGYYNNDFTVGYSVSDNYMLKNVNVSLRDAHDTTGNQYRANCYNNQAETVKDDSGTCTVHLPTNLPDGEYYVQIGGQDQAGLYTVNATRTINIDRSDPTVAITSPTANQVVNGHSVTIKGTATDDNFNYYYCYVTVTGHGEVGTRDAKCQTAWAAGTPSKTAFADTANGTTNGTLGSVDLTGVVDGNYTVHVVAKDKAGNSTEATQNFVLDNNAPVLTVNGQSTKDRTPTITGTVDDPSLAVSVTVNNKTYSATVANDGTWSVTIPNSDKLTRNTTYDVTATATDTAGNTGTDPTSGELTIEKKNGGGGGGTTTGGGTGTVVDNNNDQDANSGNASSNGNTNGGSATSGNAGNVNSTNFTTNSRSSRGALANPATNQFIATTTPNGTASPAQSNTDNEGSVLGTKTDNNPASDSNDTVALATSNQGWQIFGLAWYWVLLILAALIAAIWYILAGARRRRDDQA